MAINGLALPTHRIDIVITSSRDPSSRIRSFLNDLEALIPNSIKINRGKLSLDSLFIRAKTIGSKYLVIIESDKGNPSKILVYNIVSNYLKYTLNLKGISTLSDFGIKRNKIKGRGCLGEVECKEFIQFLVDMNLLTINDQACVYHINIVKRQDYCEISFIDKFQKYVGPIIRVNDFNINSA